MDSNVIPPLPDGFEIQANSSGSTSNLPPLPEGFQVQDNTPDVRGSKIIPQITKGLYDTIPFGKRIISMMPNAKQIQDNMESTPNPQGILPSVGRGVGEAAGYAPAAATGEGLVPSAIAMGTQAVGQAQSEGKTPLEAIGEGAKTAGGTVVGGKILGAVGNKIADTFSSKALENRIYGLYNESVGTRIKNVGDVNKVQPNRVNAIKTISDNLPEVKLPNPETGALESRSPDNRLDLLHAFQQTKTAVWKKVSALSGGATERGATIDLPSIADKALADAKANIGQDALKANPTLSAALDNEANKIKLIGQTTPTRAQDYMKYMTQEVQRLRQSGQAVDFSVKDLYSSLLPKLGEATDTAIEYTLAKSGYTEYRQQYASLKSAEKEILASANKYLRSQGGQTGVHPIINLWSVEEALQAGGHLATGNPVGAGMSLARAGAIKTASKLVDYFKNPDRKISKMFELAGKYKNPIVPGEAAVPVNAELIRPSAPNSPLGIGQSKPIMRSSRLLPSDVGQSSGPTLQGQPQPKLPAPAQRPNMAKPNTPNVIHGQNPIQKLPFYSMDESGRIKGDGFLLGEKRLTANDVNDKLIDAEKPVDAMGNMETVAHEDQQANIQMRAEMAKDELRMLQSVRKDLSGSINPKEFNRGEFQDAKRKLSWATGPQGRSLDEKATEFFHKYPHMYPQNFHGHPGDALGAVVKDITENRGIKYVSELRNTIMSAKKSKRSTVKK